MHIHILYQFPVHRNTQANDKPVTRGGFEPPNLR